jgi:hypothetical protein
LDNDDGYDLVSSDGSSSVLFEVAYEGGQKRNDNLGLGDNQIHAGRFYLMRKINKTKFKHVANCTAWWSVTTIELKRWRLIYLPFRKSFSVVIPSDILEWMTTQGCYERGGDSYKKRKSTINLMFGFSNHKNSSGRDITLNVTSQSTLGNSPAASLSNYSNKATRKMKYFAVPAVTASSTAEFHK